jgi:hypothetical protein
MQGWIVVGAWLFAVALGLVLLGFTGYELSWKSRRLETERAKLDRLLHQLDLTGADLQDSTERAKRLAAGSRPTSAD